MTVQALVHMTFNHKLHSKTEMTFSIMVIIILVWRIYNKKKSLENVRQFYFPYTLSFRDN